MKRPDDKRYRPRGSTERWAVMVVIRQNRAVAFADAEALPEVVAELIDINGTVHIERERPSTRYWWSRRRRGEALR